MANGCLDCMRRFSQVILIITNIVVALLGLCVMIIGIWANVNGNNYVDITDSNSQFTQVSVLVIVLGLFVLIIGGVGVVGAIFASTIFGRIVLGLYAVVLTLLVICEISGGIAAAVKKGELENVFFDSANTTLHEYLSDDSKQQAWDTFQKSFKCCGINGTKDYRMVYGNETVPLSCCIHADDENAVDECQLDDFDSPTLHQQGCVQKLIDGFSSNLGAIAGGVIVLGLIQIFGIVMACFVALYKRDENKYEVV